MRQDSRWHLRMTRFVMHAARVGVILYLEQGETKVRNKHIGLGLLALVAAVAFSAVAVISASAATLEPGGEFKIASKSSTFETKGGEKLTCKEATGSGKTSGTKDDTAEVKFKKCTASVLECQTGTTKGEIVLKETSELVDINKSKSEVGIILALPEPLAIECTGISKEKLKVRGATLCPVTPVGSPSKEFKVTCKEKKGVQEPTEYENEKGEKVKSPITETEGKGEGIGTKTFSYEQSALEGTDTLTFETTGEIKP